MNENKTDKKTTVKEVFGVERLLKQSVQQLEPYHVDLAKPKIKMDANENNWLAGRFQPALKEMIDSLPLHQYPDSECLALRHKLALMNGVRPEQVVTGVGSDQIIAWIVQAFVEAGDRVLMMDPTFSMYEINTLMAGGIPLKVPLGSGFVFDPEPFLRQAHAAAPKVVFLTNPNNPTGGVIPSAILTDLIDELSQMDCVVVVDEAYYEFYGETAVEKINESDRLVILRTLSKAYGLAGIRAGYAMASNVMISALNRVKPPYHMSALDQMAALVCLEQADELKPVLLSVTGWREKLAEAFSGIDPQGSVRVFDSKANFLLIHSPGAAGLDALLKDCGILVRSYGSTGPLADCLRITVGTEEENRQLLDVINQYFGQKPAEN
jgi:histidinol-phosphate aminotransferase